MECRIEEKLTADFRCFLLSFFFLSLLPLHYEYLSLIGM